MQKKAWLPINIISLLLVFLAFPRSASAYYTNMPASVVVGQPDFTSTSPGTTQSKLNVETDGAVFIDPKGRLIVADHSNNRVLVWNRVPTTNNVPADIVLGQPDFTSSTVNNGGRSASSMGEPKQVYSDGERLFVADRLNGRILIWNPFPTQNGQAADVVVGKPDFTSSLEKCDQATFGNRTSGVWVHDNTLITFDRNQRRVLIWNSVPKTNGASADVVLGHDDFTTCSVEPVSESSFSTTMATVFVDYAGRLYVTDGGNNRIFVWNNIPTENNTPADFVIGQTDFVSNSAGTGRSQLSRANHLYSDGTRLFVSDTGNHRVLIFNTIPTGNGAQADIVLGQSDFFSSSSNGGGSTSSFGLYNPSGIFEKDNRLYVLDMNHRVLIFEDYEATATPGFTVQYPPESSGEKMRLSGNIVMGEYGKFDLRSPEVSINNQGFGPLTNFSKRQHSDHETITEFYHDFEPWAGVAPRDRWSEGDGFTAHFRATSYQSRIETQEAFLFWPFTLDSAAMESATPVISFHIPSKNVEHIKSNLDRFEVYIGKDGNFTQYLKRAPVSLVGKDGRVVVSANSEGVLTAQATFTPGEYEVKVRAFDKWGNHFDTNAVPLTLTQALVSVESTPLFSGFWFPLQINRATGINTGIISSFRPESMRASYTTTTLTPTFTGIAFADSLITMTMVNNQNAADTKTFTTTTSPDSTWSLTPTLYLDSTVSITAQKAGLSTQIPPFGVRLFNPQ